MAKLKLNLPTGAAVEKPVVTCFNIDNKSYLILDAENIGSMGLPIILVCKIEDNRVVKITDSAEWQQAKDYLKGIIAGNTMNYVPVATEMAADEVYFTQLTLPVASFDVIKNAYKVEEISTPESVVPAVEEIPVVESVIPEVSEEPKAVEVVAENTAPVVDITMPSVPETPVPEPVVPIAEEVPVVTPVIPEVPTNPEIEDNNAVDFKESKEAFMKACENMFDALVAKFQAELDSKK